MPYSGTLQKNHTCAGSISKLGEPYKSCDSDQFCYEAYPGLPGSGVNCADHLADYLRSGNKEIAGKSTQEVLEALIFDQPARQLYTCPNCGQQGYSGQYPFSTCPPNCDDCA